MGFRGGAPSDFCELMDGLGLRAWVGPSVAHRMGFGVVFDSDGDRQAKRGGGSFFVYTLIKV